MQQYLSDLDFILKNGEIRKNRSGINTIGIFGHISRYDLRDSFPLLTTKKMFWKGIVHELLWMLSGDTNIKYLNDNGVHIWDGNAESFYKLQLEKAIEESKQKQDVSPFYDMIEEGNLGPVYGKQWRDFNGFDQISKVIDQIKNDPESRRIIFSAWNPGQIEQMALPPCHVMAQFYINNGELSCMMTQRSADFGLGVPFNVASYSLLTCIFAHICDLKPGEFIHSIGDAHIYVNHIEALKEQMERTPKDPPTLSIDSESKNIENLKYENFIIKGYDPYPSVKMSMAV